MDLKSPVPFWDVNTMMMKNEGGAIVPTEATATFRIGGGGGIISGTTDDITAAIKREISEFAELAKNPHHLALRVREAAVNQLQFMQRPGGPMDPTKEGNPSIEETKDWFPVTLSMEFNGGSPFQYACLCSLYIQYESSL